MISNPPKSNILQLVISWYAILHSLGEQSGGASKPKNPSIRMANWALQHEDRELPDVLSRVSKLVGSQFYNVSYDLVHVHIQKITNPVGYELYTLKMFTGQNKDRQGKLEALYVIIDKGSHMEALALKCKAIYQQGIYDAEELKYIVFESIALSELLGK